MRKYGGKLLIKPSKQSIQTHLKKVKEIIKANKAAKQVNLIGLLNPVLRGWANYHRHAVAKKTFARNDSQVWFLLWQWAKRRHPNKGARWVKARYFTTRKSRDWMFAATVDSHKRKMLTLFLEGDTPIRRHVKIRMEANPHDPVWKPYFEARKERLMKSTPKCFRVPEQGAFAEA